jgi:hypothetical protein
LPTYRQVHRALHQPTQEAILHGLPELAASRWAAQREGLAHKGGKLSQRERDISAMCNGALEKLLHGSITEQQYKNFVEPNEREAADIAERLTALEKARATLDENTEQVRAEAIDLAGTWERASLDDKLDLQRSGFGRYLYFELERGQGFLNQRNALLTKIWSYFTSTIPTDTDWIEKLQTIKSDPEDEDCKVGVSDGV